MVRFYARKLIKAYSNTISDADTPHKIVKNLEECMELCSRFWNEAASEGCFGAVLTLNNMECWIKNSTVNDNDPNTNPAPPGTQSALVVREDMEALNKECVDGSTHRLDSIEYTIHCGKFINNNDARWQGYPSYNERPYKAFYHAKDIEECMKFCIAEHPLCRAVTFNPNLETGYANCWPKTGAPSLDPSPSGRTSHSAVIDSLDIIDTECPKDKSYAAPGDKHFEIHCSQVNTGRNITSLHMKNITSCLDACASSTQNCTGIVFDSSLQAGYQNCYLQNSTNVIIDREKATYALLTDSTPTPSSNDAHETPDDGNSEEGSKAWIAGAVIGGVAGVAIIAFAIFWWRRRKNKSFGHDQYSRETQIYNVSGTYSGLHEAGHHDISELDQMHAVKYAHMAPAAVEAPSTPVRGHGRQELP